MILQVQFNTLSGKQTLLFSRNELVDSDLVRIYDSLLSQRDSGVIGATYRLPQYPSLIECALLDSKDLPSCMGN